MVYETFLKEVKEKLKLYLGSGFTVNLRHIPKNNGLLMDGVCIVKGTEQISPTIYLNTFYAYYRNGMPMEEIILHIMKLYQENISLPEVDINELIQLDQLRNKIVYKLINHNSNTDLLNDIPHIPILDLAIVFYLLLGENENGQMTALIHHEHSKSWDLSTSELYQIAKYNTPRLMPPIIKNMRDVMKEIALENLGDDYKEEYMEGLIEDNAASAPLYVMTNINGLHGSCCILYENVLKNFADSIGHDLIILPSSIHEVLLVPDGGQIAYENLGDMVTDINHSEVPLEDQLSNQIYLYSKADQELSIVSVSSAPIGTENP